MSVKSYTCVVETPDVNETTPDLGGRGGTFRTDGPTPGVNDTRTPVR